jgi:hypothetical protein
MRRDAPFDIRRARECRNFVKRLFRVSRGRIRPKGTADLIPLHDEYYDILLKKQSLGYIDDSNREIAKQENQECAGVQIYKRIVKGLVHTKRIKLLSYQLRLAEMCIVPALPGIYGDDF